MKIKLHRILFVGSPQLFVNKLRRGSFTYNCDDVTIDTVQELKDVNFKYVVADTNLPISESSPIRHGHKGHLSRCTDHRSRSERDLESESKIRQREIIESLDMVNVK